MNFFTQFSTPDFGAALSGGTSIPVLGTGIMMVFAVFIVVTLILERALTAVYATGLWEKAIGAPMRRKGITDTKLYLAIIVNVGFMLMTNLDAFSLMFGVKSSVIGAVITGLFSSGGSKAWADLFGHIQNMREGKVDKLKLEAQSEKTKIMATVAQNGIKQSDLAPLPDKIQTVRYRIAESAEMHVLNITDINPPLTLLRGQSYDLSSYKNQILRSAEFVAALANGWIETVQ